MYFILFNGNTIQQSAKTKTPLSGIFVLISPLFSFPGAPFQQVLPISGTSMELNPAMEEGATNPGDTFQFRAYDLHEVG